MAWNRRYAAPGFARRCHLYVLKKTPPAEGGIQILGTSAQCNAGLDFFRVTSIESSLERTVCVGEEAMGWNPFVLRSNLHFATPLVARQHSRTNPFFDL